MPATRYPTISNSTVVQAQHPIVSGGDYPTDRADRHQNSSAYMMAFMHGYSSSSAVTQMGNPSAAFTLLRIRKVVFRGWFY